MTIIEQIKILQAAFEKEYHQDLLSNQYAWWLLEKALHRPKSELILHSNFTVAEAEQEQLDQWVQEIVKHHKPIAYILGTVPFGPLSIAVRPPVLIPRPETEEWALMLAQALQASGARRLTILDMCTGSGCIALLLAHMLPDAMIYAIDICEDTLMLAEENKKTLGITNVRYIQSDLFEHIPHGITYDLIVSNPPYISTQEFNLLEPSVALWEDKQALWAADEGLAIIQKILEEAPRYIKANELLQQCAIHQLYIEIGWKQAVAVKKIMQKIGYTAITIQEDSAHKERVISGRVPHVAIAANQ